MSKVKASFQTPSLDAGSLLTQHMQAVQAFPRATLCVQMLPANADIWAKVKGVQPCTLPCGSPVRIEYECLPFSYGTESYVILTYVPERRTRRDVTKAIITSVQYQFSERGKQHFDVSIAEERAALYAQYLFGDATLTCV